MKMILFGLKTFIREKWHRKGFMTKPQISIVTPSYHQGKYIERTIQSVLSQDVDALEYMVVDGGSIDETVSILRQYKDRLQWVSEADEGQSDAVNKGINKTSGDIIGWLNSDDIYYPDAVKKVLQFFADHPDVDVVYGASNEIDSNDKITGKYLTESWDLNRLKVHCFISQPATFFRRRIIEKHGLLDTTLNFCMDYEFWLRLGLNGAKVAYLPEVLAATRLYADTKSSRGFLQAHYEAINMLQQKLGYIPSDWIVNYSSAKVKAETGLSFPNPKFVTLVWRNLWKISGLYNDGAQRVVVWLKAQTAMFRKTFSKLVRI